MRHHTPRVTYFANPVASAAVHTGRLLLLKEVCGCCRPYDMPVGRSLPPGESETPRRTMLRPPSNKPHTTGDRSLMRGFRLPGSPRFLPGCATLAGRTLQKTLSPEEWSRLCDEWTNAPILAAWPCTRGPCLCSVKVPSEYRESHRHRILNFNNKESEQTAGPRQQTPHIRSGSAGQLCRLQTGRTLPDGTRASVPRILC